MNRILKWAGIFYKYAVDVDDWVDFSEIREGLGEFESIDKDERLVGFRELIGEAVLKPDLSGETNGMLLGDIADFVKVNYDAAKSKMMKLEQEYEKTKKNKHLVNRAKRVMHAADDVMGSVVLETDDEDWTFYSSKRGSQFWLDALNDRVRVGLDGKNFVSLNAFLEMFSSLSGKRLNSLLNIKLEESNMFEWNKEFKNRKKVLDKSKGGEVEVVFSVDHKDIYGMSSRSDWKSCQRAYKIKDELRGQAYPENVVGSCLSKNVGVIYLTNKDNYKDRGEEMLYRSQVMLVRNKENNYILFVGPSYPENNIEVKNIFEGALERNLSLPTTTEVQDIIFEAEDWDKTKGKYYPYFDKVNEEKIEIEYPTRRDEEHVNQSNLLTQQIMQLIGSFLNMKSTALRLAEGDISYKDTDILGEDIEIPPLEEPPILQLGSEGEIIEENIEIEYDFNILKTINNLNKSGKFGYNKKVNTFLGLEKISQIINILDKLMNEIDLIDEKDLYQHIIFDWQQRIESLKEAYDIYIKRYGSFSHH